MALLTKWPVFLQYASGNTTCPLHKPKAATINRGLQALTRCEPFVAAIMLRCTEPTKERGELTVFSIIAIEIKGGRSHFLRLRLRSCSKIFESGSGNFSNSRIRLLFRLRLQSSIQPKFTYVFT